MTESTVTESLEASRADSVPKAAYYYDLPIDASEHSRLDLQHQIIILAQGGLYPEKDLVEKAIGRAAADGRANILDIGTGSGAWAIDMARQFPQANVLGVDIVLPSVPDTHRPSNCRFEIADVNKDMESFEPIYDVVQWRLVEMATLDTDLFFYQVARILRPGGVLIAVGANARAVDKSGVVFPLNKPGDPGYSSYQDTLCRHLSNHLKKGPFRLKHPLWNSVFESNPNFSNVKIKDVFIPLGPWSPDLSAHEQQLGRMMNENLQRVLPAFAPTIRQSGGWSDEEIDSLLEGALREVKDLPPTLHGYSRWVFAVAVRNSLPWAGRGQPWQEPPEFDPYDYLIRPWWSHT